MSGGAPHRVEPLFPEWSNTTIRLGLGLLVALVVGIPLGAMAWVRTPYNYGVGTPADQPVEFDHRHHVRDDGIECRYCHTTADRAATAGMPSTELCMGCHSQIWNGGPQLEPVRRAWFAGASIAWNRVHTLPDFVFFDHSVHVAGGIGCESCHGRVDLMARVWQTAPLTMAWCLDCHRAPERHLRPRDAITTMGWVPPGDPAAVGAALARAYGTRKLTTCSTCHR